MDTRAIKTYQESMGPHISNFQRQSEGLLQPVNDGLGGEPSQVNLTSLSYARWGADGNFRYVTKNDRISPQKLSKTSLSL